MSSQPFEPGDRVVLRDKSPEANVNSPTAIGSIVARGVWTFADGRIQTKYRVNFITNTGYSVYNSELELHPEQIVAAPPLAQRAA